MANTTTANKGTNPSQSLDKAKDAGYQAVDKAKDAASAVGEMASHAASAAGKVADNLTASAGSGIKNLADTISEHTPREGLVGSASQAVASTLKQGGKYLEESGLSGMAEDVTEMIRRNPVPAVLIGIGVGFLLGRALRS
jgi:hypothetical protein